MGALHRSEGVGSSYPPSTGPFLSVQGAPTKLGDEEDSLARVRKTT